MTTDIAVRDDQDRGRWVTPMDEDDATAALAHVLGTGDLYQLSNEQRVAHYINLCREVGVSALSRPYQWIEFKDGDNPPVLTLYFKPSAAAQVLRNNHITVDYPRKEIVGELFVWEAHGRAPDGREGTGTKYVALTNRYGKLTGKYLANAIMSAETGALRRLALNMGLASGPDPDEHGTMRTVYVDGTGAVLEKPTEEQRHLADNPGVAHVLGEPTYETTAADWPEQANELPDQRPRPEEYDPPKRSIPRQSFRPSEDDVKRHLGAWFAAVKGTSLDDDDARHRYVAGWTAQEGWPKAKQTDSLRAAFGRMTEREASDFLAHVRAIAEDERAANREALADSNRDEAAAEADEGAF